MLCFARDGAGRYANSSSNNPLPVTMQFWNDRYNEPGFAYGLDPNDFLSQSIDKLPAGRTLSLAEGEGRNALYLAQHGHCVTAVDSSQVGMEKAAKLAAENGVAIETVCTDLANFMIGPGEWDCIVSIFCHVAPVIRAPLHQQVVAGLKPGGVLLLEAYTPEQLALGTGGPQDATLTMTLDALQQELAGLDFEIGIELTRDVIEGKYHTGKGAVVQLLARKPDDSANPYNPYI